MNDVDSILEWLEQQNPVLADSLRVKMGVRKKAGLGSLFEKVGIRPFGAPKTEQQQMLDEQEEGIFSNPLQEMMFKSEGVYGPGPGIVNTDQWSFWHGQ